MSEGSTPGLEYTVIGRTLAPGAAAGRALVLEEAISFWGGVDAASGRVIDGRHPQFGQSLSGWIVLLPSGRGSSSSSSVLAECVRAGTAPAAIVLLRADPIIALGAVVAAELYGHGPPVLTLPEDAYRSIRTGDEVAVQAVEGEAFVRILPSTA
jgi:predicted aconitase with swiveling domain